MAPFFKWHLTYYYQHFFINLPKLRKINLHPSKNCMAQSRDPTKRATTAAIWLPNVHIANIKLRSAGGDQRALADATVGKMKP